jgi:hypothetical protein
MGRTGDHHVQQNKSDSKRYCMFFSYVEYREKIRKHESSREEKGGWREHKKG